MAGAESSKPQGGGASVRDSAGASKTQPQPPGAAEQPDAASRRDAVTFELSITAADQHDTVRRAIPLLPYGTIIYGTAGGRAEADATVWVEPPVGIHVGESLRDSQPVSERPAHVLTFRNPHLQIFVGPTIERSLAYIVLGPPAFRQPSAQDDATETETAASDLLAALALKKLLAQGSPLGDTIPPALDQRIRAEIGQLVSAQNEDGGWGWSHCGQASDRYVSARVLWALSLAKRAGYTIPAENFDLLTRYVTQQIAATDNSDFESKAILLHALSVAGNGDFSLANRLYRERPSLSTAALLYVALALAEMDRLPIAG